MALYVIQLHAATTVHYDLRLEVDGVLRSWAVPRGPSTDPADKRLAVEVADHAMSHADFEGPTGRGGVIVWDRGTWRALDASRSPAEWLADGHLSFHVDGRKLRGGFTLQRTDGGRRPQWLLIKRRDEDADGARDPVAEQPESVLSGRTLEQVAAGG